VAVEVALPRLSDAHCHGGTRAIRTRYNGVEKFQKIREKGSLGELPTKFRLNYREPCLPTLVDKVPTGNQWLVRSSGMAIGCRSISSAAI
jgi:hypothetical protein